MVTKISAPTFTWTDLEQAASDVITKTVKELQLHPLLAGELTRITRVSKIERYGEAVLLVFQIPYVTSRGDIKSHELDFVVGKTFLITSSSAPIPAVEHFRKRLTNPRVRERYFSRDTGALLYAILIRVFNRILPMMDDLEQGVEEIEEGIFEGKEQTLITKISLIHRNIIDLRRALSPARPVLEAFVYETREWFDPHTVLQLRRLSGTSQRVSHLLDAHRETIAALEQTTQAIFSTKISRILLALTVLTATALPFTVISSIYGMNVELPGAPESFWPLVGAMATTSFTMFALFRLRKWI